MTKLEIAEYFYKFTGVQVFENDENSCFVTLEEKEIQSVIETIKSRNVPFLLEDYSSYLKKSLLKNEKKLEISKKRIQLTYVAAPSPKKIKPVIVENDSEQEDGEIIESETEREETHEEVQQVVDSPKLCTIF